MTHRFTISLVSLFHFLAQPASSGKYSFEVEKTYSDGSIGNCSGPESSVAPAIEVKSSLDGGSSTLAIVALLPEAVALTLRGVALGRRGGTRPLA